jgi:3beta-hydroxy-delta5-steroid dehydrogenase/steroid delta-isomerase
MSKLSGTRCLVTGGAGFVGGRLAAKLLESGAEVRILDRRRGGLRRVETILGDIADREVCARATDGIDFVFHTAWVMSLNDRSPRRVRCEAERTNVGGSKSLIAAARRAGARGFVFTSSNHVVLGKDAIRGGDETLPYADEAPDLYTRTKIAAERLILAAHDPAGMMTCALRPGGIYGPGDSHFVPRVIDFAIRFGLIPRLGWRSSIIDITHVHNHEQAQMLAAERLEPGSQVGGNAYFVSDDDPIRVDDFVRLVLAALDRHATSVAIPVRWHHAAIRVWERLWAHSLLPRPPIGGCELRTVTTAHHFDISRARRELGYSPRFDAERGARDAARDYRQRYDRGADKEMAAPSEGPSIRSLPLAG